MTCEELYQLMNAPAKLSEKTLPELKQIAEDFPYFHAVQMLYLKTLQDTALPMARRGTLRQRTLRPKGRR